MRVFNFYLNPRQYKTLQIAKMISSISLIGSIVLVLQFYFFAFSNYVFYGTIILFFTIVLELFHNFKIDTDIHRSGFEILFIYTLSIIIAESNDVLSIVLFGVMGLSILESEFVNLLLKKHNKEVKAFLLIKNLENTIAAKYESFHSAEQGTYGAYYVDDLFQIDISEYSYYKKEVTITYKEENITIITRRKSVFIAFFEPITEKELLEETHISMKLKDNFIDNLFNKKQRGDKQ